ncbi:hypothetical protein HanRHA438_Chr04g0177751 [Helianthus annuus]|nr:hypothetical protein HanRHA438_Chr04g0177751 [Helianthus annuus]
MNVKLQSLFDPFSFEIVERNLPKFLFVVSYRPLVMTHNPSLLTFHTRSCFSVYACV